MMHQSCSSKIVSSKIVKHDSAVIKFNVLQKNFGFIKEGFNPTFVFEFENIGNSTLLISKVETECNCTVAEYSTNLIVAKGKGFIKVDFKSSGNLGSFNKAITVFSNATEKEKKIYIKGIVISSGK
jgi:hypothetical protein